MPPTAMPTEYLSAERASDQELRQQKELIQASAPPKSRAALYGWLVLAAGALLGLAVWALRL